jgi:hypothetical protein
VRRADDARAHCALCDAFGRFKTRGRAPAEQPVSPAADAELNRLYRLYRDRLTEAQRSALARAESAWIAYRDKACAIEGGACLTELENERVAELKAGWVGEDFW